jgi:serine/threonine protein kinase
MASYTEIGNTGIKYSREDPLGQGAFGDVYRGIYNDEHVAVKKLLLNRYEKEEREVDLQKILNHENVLKIRKVEEDDNFRYY